MKTKEIKIEIPNKTFKIFSEYCKAIGSDYSNEIKSFIEDRADEFKVYKEKSNDDKKDTRDKTEKNSKKPQKKQQKSKPKKTTKKEKIDRTNIYERKSGTYQIRKSLNGELKHYGTYKTIDEALKVKAELIKVGWDKNQLERIKKELGME